MLISTFELIPCMTGEGCKRYRDPEYQMGGFWVDDEVRQFLSPVSESLSSQWALLICQHSVFGQIYIHWICRNYIGYCTRSPQSCWSVSLGGTKASLWVYHCPGELRRLIFWYEFLYCFKSEGGHLLTL